MEVRDHDSHRFLAFDGSATGPQLLKVRCPSCRKLYSVDPASFSSGTDVHFECINCKCQFEAKQPSSLIALTLESIEILRSPSPRVGAFEAPVSARNCPKCGSPTSFSAQDCARCGVIFARYKPASRGFEDGLAGEIRIEGRRDITELWENVMADYENSSRHDAFVTACFDAQLLAFASRQYARILAASPNEEIARGMRRKIIALASFRAEPSGRSWVPQFRVPKFINLVLVLGGAVLTMGQILPNAKNLTGIGIAAIALALGVRFFLQRPGR